MKISDKPMLSWRHLLFAVVALAVVMPSAAFNGPVSELGPMNATGKAPLTEEKEVVSVQRVRGCTVWQPCDRQGNKLKVERDDRTVILGLLAGLVARS